jgi:Na+/melibiose symporter-like transporter
VPWPVARDLALIYGPGASLITLMGVLILFGYRLDRATHASIIDDLATRGRA